VIIGSFFQKLSDLLWDMNKKKSRAWSVTGGLYLPTVRGSKLGSAKKILFDHDLVKVDKPQIMIDYFLWGC